MVDYYECVVVRLVSPSTSRFSLAFMCCPAEKFWRIRACLSFRVACVCACGLRAVFAVKYVVDNVLYVFLVDLRWVCLPLLCNQVKLGTTIMALAIR